MIHLNILTKRYSSSVVFDMMERRNPISLVSFVEQQQFDEKNIRRRVYDALNVLMAMDIISKDKKEIQWKGLPRTSLNDIEELKVCSLWNTLSYFNFTFVRNVFPLT